MTQANNINNPVPVCHGYVTINLSVHAKEGKTLADLNHAPAAEMKTITATIIYAMTDDKIKTYVKKLMQRLSHQKNNTTGQ